MDDGSQPIDVEESSEFAYAEAYRLLAESKEQAFAKYRGEAAKRRRIVAIMLLVWLAVAVLLYVAVSPDMMVIGELGLAACVVFAVFYLLPSVMAKSNLGEAFDQYQAQIERLEAAAVPLPVCGSIEELADLLSLVSVPDDME